MEEYIPNREKFVKKYKLKGILNAVEEMDQHISNLEVIAYYHINFFNDGNDGLVYLNFLLKSLTAKLGP